GTEQGQAVRQIEGLDLVDAVGTARDVQPIRSELMTSQHRRAVEVEDQVAHDESEAKRDNRQVVSAKAERRDPDQEGEGKRDEDDDEQRCPERVTLVNLVTGHQRVGIGTDPEEGDEAKIQQSRITDYQIE